MKKVIRAFSDTKVAAATPEDASPEDKRYLMSIQTKMKRLFDTLDDTPKGFAERYDLETLYDELSICIRETDTQLNKWGL